MVEGERPTPLKRSAGFLFFLSITVACILWFLWSSYHIVEVILKEEKVVYFDKGSLYMLGAGIGLGALTFAILYEGVLSRELTNSITRGVTRVALGGVVVMFLLPHVFHYSVSVHLSKQGYTVCSGASSQWLLYKKVVYTKTEPDCEALVNGDGAE